MKLELTPQQLLMIYEDIFTSFQYFDLAALTHTGDVKESYINQARIAEEILEKIKVVAR